VSTHGLRSAALGVGPGGSLKITNAVVHTAGHDSSPIFHAVGPTRGTIQAAHVHANADGSPMVIIDGSHNFELEDSILTGTGIGGVVVTSSDDNRGHPQIVLKHDTLLTWGGGPSLWFGNCNATMNIVGSTFQSYDNMGGQGVLVIANGSRTRREYDGYDMVPANANPQPTVVNITVSDTALAGDIHALGGATVAWNLKSYTSWLGSTNILDSGAIDVFLSNTSEWQVTGQNAVLRGFVSEDPLLMNVFDMGNNISYDCSHMSNAWLGGKTHALQDGGYLTPRPAMGSQP
jgi:hypothetical protein